MSIWETVERHVRRGLKVTKELHGARIMGYATSPPSILRPQLGTAPTQAPRREAGILAMVQVLETMAQRGLDVTDCQVPIRLMGAPAAVAEGRHDIPALLGGHKRIASMASAQTRGTKATLHNEHVCTMKSTMLHRKMNIAALQKSNRALRKCRKATFLHTENAQSEAQQSTMDNAHLFTPKSATLHRGVTILCTPKQQQSDPKGPK